MKYIPQKKSSPSNTAIDASIVQVANIALGTLGGETALLRAGPSMTRGGKLVSGTFAVAIAALTAGDGPFMFGVADKRLSLAQLTAYLEANGPVSPDSLTAMEATSRGKYVRPIGIVNPEAGGTTASLFVKDRSLSGLRFTEENAGWNYYLYNIGRAVTTGATWTTWSALYAKFNPSE